MEQDQSALLEQGRVANALFTEGKYDEALDAYLTFFPWWDAEDKQNIANFANSIGYIYSRNGTKNYDLNKATHFLKIAADGDILYAQELLARLISGSEQKEDQLYWAKRAGKNGSAECSYFAYRILKSEGHLLESEEFIKLAASQGQAIAIRDLSFRYMKGMYGIHLIPTGIFMFLANLGNLWKWARRAQAYADELR